MQLYKGLPIITNKITQDEMKGVPHHLLGRIGLEEETWTVGKFVANALEVVGPLLLFIASSQLTGCARSTTSEIEESCLFSLVGLTITHNHFSSRIRYQKNLYSRTKKMNRIGLQY